MKTLIVVTGAEGAGKSTIMSALLPHTPRAAKVDAEDVGQVNPFSFDQAFLDLLWSNLTAVISNFWAAGFTTVITGSFLDRDTHSSLQEFRDRLGQSPTLYMVHLVPSKAARDRRRILRHKASSEEWRDAVDAGYEQHTSSLGENAGDFHYIAIDNSDQTVSETVTDIRASIPAVYGGVPTTDVGGLPSGIAGMQASPPSSVPQPGGSPVDAVERPTVVCLCGSLRFQHLFESERRRLTARGVIVLGPEAIGDELTPSARAALGELHLRRIDLADEVRVVSEGGYVGSATRREIAYARENCKVVSSIEPTLEL